MPLPFLHFCCMLSHVLPGKEGGEQRSAFADRRFGFRFDLSQSGAMACTALHTATFAHTTHCCARALLIQGSQHARFGLLLPVPGGHLHCCCGLAGHLPGRWWSLGWSGVPTSPAALCLLLSFLPDPAHACTHALHFCLFMKTCLCLFHACLPAHLHAWRSESPACTPAASLISPFCPCHHPVLCICYGMVNIVCLAW